MKDLKKEEEILVIINTGESLYNAKYLHEKRTCLPSNQAC